MKIVFKIAGALLLLVVLAGAGAYGWASTASARVLARTVDTHRADFPIPFPLTRDEVVALGLTPQEAEAVARERAVERGRHLVAARYACSECHGKDFSGGVMVDAPPIGRLLGPNLTSGRGSRVLAYEAADWDRIVRHGVRPDGSPAAMPSEDFERMSDRELSDIVTFLRAQPPVDNDVPPIKLGPLGKFLLATGRLPLSADLIDAHDAPHAALPPATEASVEFGRHLAAVCTGCHKKDLSGGPIPGGDPSWVAARNLTPHATALGSWTYEQFAAAMRDGTRPDGTALRAPMTLVSPYARNMTDVEMEALWAYLRSVPAVESDP